MSPTFSHSLLLSAPCHKHNSIQVIERAPSYVLWVGGSIGLTYGSIAWADALTKAEDYSHRP